MKEAIREKVRNFVGEYQKRDGIETDWGTPLIGFASAEDPLFAHLRKVVSATHAVPTDLLEEAKTVVAFFLPFRKAMTSTNRQFRNCSEPWVVAYLETNEMIRQLSLSLQSFIDSEGHKTVVIPATHNFDKKRLISDWSHRHVAYIAGLGSFGLNNMLITEKGCCGRVGTFVTSAEIPPDTRGSESACLHKYDGSCGKCAQRCVNEALFDNSFDRFACYKMCLENEKRHRSLGFADVCGKCLVAVPCSHTNPVLKKRTREKTVR